MSYKYTYIVWITSSKWIHSPRKGTSDWRDNNSQKGIYTKEIWDCNEISIENLFSFTIAIDITNDFEPQNIGESKQRHDWSQGTEAIQVELTSLAKQEIFRLVVQTPKDVKPVGYKWIFVRKYNEYNEITRYKAWLVAQGFSQRPNIDYKKMYYPVMDTITCQFLISLAISERLNMRPMVVMTAYLYGSLDTNIYIKIL